MNMKTDPHIEELIDKALVEHGYSRNDFSKKEIAELRSEIIAEENGPMGHFAWWDMSQPLVNTSVMDDSKF